MPEYKDIPPVEPSESLLPVLAGYEDDEHYVPDTDEQPVSVPEDAEIVPLPVLEVPTYVEAPPLVDQMPAFPSAQEVPTYVEAPPIVEMPVSLPIAEEPTYVEAPPVIVSVPAPLPLPEASANAVTLPTPLPPAVVPRPEPSQVASGLRVMEVPDQPVQIYSVEPVAAPVPVAALPTGQRESEEPAYTILADNNPSTSLELFSVLPEKPKPQKKHFFSRPKQPHVAAKGRGVSAVVHGGLTAVLVISLLLTGSYLLFGRGDTNENFHGAPPAIVTTADKLNTFLSGIVNQDRYSWEVIFFDDATQTDGRVRLLTPGSPFTVTFSAGVTCDLPPMTILEEEKDGNHVVRAQRTIVCPDPWEVETTGNGTTDCTERSDGNTFDEISDTYTIKSGVEVIGHVKMRCQIMTDESLPAMPASEARAVAASGAQAAGFLEGVKNVLNIGGRIKAGLNTQAKARNEVRKRDVQVIAEALRQYEVEHGGYPSNIPSGTEVEICRFDAQCEDLLDFSATLPDFLPEMPHDPSAADGAGTRYFIIRDEDDRITVSAPDAEGEQEIKATL